MTTKSGRVYPADVLRDDIPRAHEDDREGAPLLSGMFVLRHRVSEHVARMRRESMTTTLMLLFKITLAIFMAGRKREHRRCDFSIVPSKQMIASSGGAI